MERIVATARWVVPAVAGAVGYAFWATAQPAFGRFAYVAVAIPVALVVAAVLVGRGGRSAAGRVPRVITLAAAWPWLLIGVLIAGLETAGLALGGRSAAVPTLSTVVDHTLAWHVVRAALFVGWLLLGWCVVGLTHAHRRF